MIGPNKQKYVQLNAIPQYLESIQAIRKRPTYRFEDTIV